jgi:oligo-1,6-glucosidase
MLERNWWKESVVYQIYPRSFQDSNGDGIGDLNGITKRLPYIKGLGVDVIWLSPVYQSPNDDNGYDISDYRAIMGDFGNMEDFDKMLSTAHSLGLKIMMDLVVNHTSDEHAWFVESRKSKDNPYRDYYFWRDGNDDNHQPPNDWGSCFSGSAWQYDEQTQQYYLHLFSKKQPDLNWDNPQVRQEVFDMMNWWVDKGIDGFRMDVISLISKPDNLTKDNLALNGIPSFDLVANGHHVHEYLQEMRQNVLNRRDLITVGECAGVTVEEAKKYASLDGKELNMVFQFEHTDVDSQGGTKWTDKRVYLPDLKKVLDKWQIQLEGVAWNSLYWCNHDQPRIVSRFGNDTPQYRELSAKMLATCLHMMQGTPYVYQGEELGMTNVPFKSIEELRDIESINAYKEYTESGRCTGEDMLKYLRCKSRDNARTPMQWDSSANAGFTSGTPWIMVNPNYVDINVEEQLTREDSVYNYYKQLIKLRHENLIIVYGKYTPYLQDSESIFAYERSLDDEKLLVLCNFSEGTVPVEIPQEFANAEVLIHNYDELPNTIDSLRPYESVVYRVKL